MTEAQENKVITLGGLSHYHSELMEDIGEMMDDVAHLGDDDGSEVIADFDPQADTVWKKEQTLSNAEKTQVQQNLGIPQTYATKSEVTAATVAEAHSAAAEITFEETT